MTFINTNIIEISGPKFETIKIGADLPLVLIAGPCAIESKDHSFYMAENIKTICEKLELNLYLNLAMTKIVGPL